MSVCSGYCPNSAGEDVARSDEVRTLVKDVWDLRIAKLRKSINIMVLQQDKYAKVCSMYVYGMCVVCVCGYVCDMCVWLCM